MAYPEPPPQPASSLWGLFGMFQVPNPQPHPIFVGPSKEQSDQLAVVLSHELAHLLLSHTLEHYAANDFYEVLTTLSTDRK